MIIDYESLPKIKYECKRAVLVKVDWSKITDEDLKTYSGKTDTLLDKVVLPRDAILCSDVNCNDISHGTAFCDMYDDIVRSLHEASRPYLTCPDKKYHSKPGWRKYVSAYHKKAKEAFKAWDIAGRPRQGQLLDQKKLTNAKYKYAVCYICKHEQVMRADLMAENLLCNNMNAFWKDVRSIHRSIVTLPCSIEGVSGAENIAELWRQHYTTLFNCVKSEPGKVEVVSSMDTGSITTNEVYQAIIQLKELKTGGLDEITAEHLKFASFRLVVLLAICFTGFMIHGLLPESMLSVTLLPVIRDKAGKVGSLDNYRPIALASVVSKVLERIILDRLGVYLDTTDNQFGFKAHHSTDLCIYALKEVVELYKRQNSTVIIGFIDASKAFDRVNHQKLFSKLRQRGIPNSILRILTYWYANQSMQIKWGNCVSDSFRVSNGVRQGSLLSPALFNVYMNELSE